MTRLSADELAIVRQVPFLAGIDDAALEALVSRARRATWRPGERIVTELEAGADVFVLLRGEAEVAIEPRRGEREVLGRLGAGTAFGEMASLTGELRSATVTAVGDVEGFSVSDEAFDDLRERRPRVAVALARTLAQRLAGAEQAIDALLAAPGSQGAEKAAARARVDRRRGSIGRAWRELVVGRRRDLAFLLFVAFVATLGLVRLGVYLSFRCDFAPMDVLRAAYMTGFALLVAGACASLLTFRPSWRRAIAVGYGVALALILNELGVTLAFDIFYKNITTPDPTVPFDVEELYRRTESVRGVLVALAVLTQLVYLRGFWRRAFFVLATRARRTWSARR